MWILILAMLALCAVMFTYTFVRNKINDRKRSRGEHVEDDVINEVDEECCGAHDVCEKDSLLAAVSKDIEYYEDEDLDRYRGLNSDEFSDEEAEEFRDVLYTLKEDEVAGWVRSLHLRQVEVPDQVKQEVFLIIGERRIH